MPMQLPNFLTLSRIVAIPLMIGLFFLPDPWGNWATLGVFVYAGVTDFLDGYLARALNQQSAFGRMFDPIADKLLVAAVLLMLVGVERLSGIHVLPAAVILCREILVSGLREVLAEARVGLPVSLLAKWKTALQMIALGLLLAGPAGPDLGPVTTTQAGLAGLWLAALATLVTGYDYLIASLRHIRQLDGGPTPP